MTLKEPRKLGIIKFLVTPLIPFIIGFIGWLFTVQKSITEIRSNQEFMKESIAEMRTDVREIRKSLGDALEREQLAEAKTNGSNHYAVENRHLR